jgi:hypothetical protein
MAVYLAIIIRVNKLHHIINDEPRHLFTPTHHPFHNGSDFILCHELPFLEVLI